MLESGIFRVGMFGLTILIFGLIIIAPFIINHSLVKSRGREKDMFLWMLFTLLLSWLITLILLIIKPKE